MGTLQQDSCFIAQGLEHSQVNGYFHPSDPGEPGTGQPRLSVNDHEGRLLASLVRRMVVLEIGTGLGVSARWMAMTAKHILTVDPDPWVIENIFPTLPPSVIGCPDYQDWFPIFDAAFLDGLHQYEQVMKDIEIMRNQVRANGLLIFHDLYIQDVRRALKDSKIAVMHIETRAGIGLAWNE